MSPSDLSPTDERIAVIGLACATLDRGKSSAHQCDAVREALPRLVDLGLARIDSNRGWRLTDAGRELARDFLRGIRMAMRRLGQKARTA